eukprot:gb/GECG01005923.1/.p1 GENE.gb/GECG01005923.1/~~gb/GECG01005923.1/.p1  ORF type:complete len:495 (+),score=27.94 gb/GECG01005923.1/:1-1485(+)
MGLNVIMRRSLLAGSATCPVFFVIPVCMYLSCCHLQKSEVSVRRTYANETELQLNRNYAGMCAQAEYTEEPRIHQHINSSRPILRILFGNNGQPGAQFLRNQMVASLASMDLRYQTDVSIRRIKDVVKARKLSGEKFDVCVGTKQYSARFAKWCRGQGAYYVHDAVDNMAFFGKKIRSLQAEARRTSRKLQMPYQSDLLFLSTNFHAETLRRYFDQRICVVPHQHTNFGGIRRGSQSFRTLTPGYVQSIHGENYTFAGTIGFLSGVANALSQNDVQTFYNIICCRLKMRLRLIQDGLPGKRQIKTVLKEYVCGLSYPITHTFERGMPSTSFKNYLGPKTLSRNALWRTQKAHHQAEHLADVDVALLWPPSTTDTVAFATRPVTRLVHWWSHGVPTVFFPYSAYVETAAKYRYLKCDEVRLHRLQYAAHPEDIEILLGVLLKDGHLRECLSRVGLKAAEDFTPTSVSSMFVDLIGELVRSNNSKYSTWSPTESTS